MTLKPILQFEPSFDEAEAQALYDYMKSGGFITEFIKTREFEAALAEFTGAKHCVVTNNGTVSLSLALLAAGVKAGDEVLVPDLSMIATANACKLLGATPVFVDIEADTLCMDLEAARDKVNARTTALIYVSLHGRCGNIEAVQQFCAQHHLFFLEDAAQSLGSTHQGVSLGRFGHAGSFSFSMPKIITTGQGGAVITDDDALAEKMQRLKDFGRAKGGTDIHDSIGYNFKFTDIQAVVGLEQMKKLPARIHKKRELYKKYQEALSSVGDLAWIKTDLTQTTPWFVDIYTEHADQLITYLKSQQIGARKIYPPIHAQKAYGLQQTFPVTERFARRGLWLPSSLQVDDQQLLRITNSIRAFYASVLS